MTMRVKHSKFAVASTLLPVAVWIYLLILAGSFFAMDKLNWSFFKGYDGAWALAVIFYLFIFIVVPLGGHLAGFVCGIIGIFSRDQKRIFAVSGLILNSLPFVGGLIFYLARYGFAI